MNIARSLKATLAASVCLLPLQALAQTNNAFDVGKPAANIQSTPDDNWISIGAQYRSGPSTYLGRFSGATDSGFYGLGDFQIRGRDAWDSGGTRYWEAVGRNLGYDDRSFSLKFGNQGTWGFGLSYDGIPYNSVSGFQTVWDKSGALAPGIAPGSLGVTAQLLGTAPGTVAALGAPYPAGIAGPAVFQAVYAPGNSPAGRMFNESIGTQRDVFAGIAKYQWNDWTISGALRHEHKSGTQIASATINGNPSTVTSATVALPTTAPTGYTTAFGNGMGYFAQPIDYDIDRYDLNAQYASKRIQLQVGYTYSNFTDNLQVINLQNPWAFTSVANSTGISAPWSLPPSNAAHQVKLLFGYNITDTTRFNANFAYGVQSQNQGFSTGTGNSLVAQAAEPSANLGGLVQTLFANFSLTAQPIKGLDLRVAYTVDDRDNQTPRNSFTGDRNSAVSGVSTVTNVPFSYDHQTFLAEAGYRVLPNLKISVNDTYETTARTYADASFVTQNTITGKIRGQIISGVNGAVSYSHQDRDANNYVPLSTWQALSLNETMPKGFLLSFEASRVRDEAKASVDLSLIPNMSASLMVKYADDRYPDSTYGLRNNHNLTIGPDVSWQVTPALNAHAFYSYQQLYYEQAGVYQSSNAINNPTPPTTSQYVVPWSNKTTDSVHTAGVTVDWQAIKDVLKFSIDYNFAYGDTAYAIGDSISFFGATVGASQVTQQSLNLQALPDVTSMLNMVSIRGEYTFRPNMTLMFGYAFEKFTYKDFMNGTSSTYYGNALLPGYTNPNDAIHVVGAGMRVKF